MYQLFTDKDQTFECTVNLEGAALDEAKARIICETNDINIMWNGSINSDGTCQISIKKLKKVLPEGTTGNMKLEIIAEDVLFTPWSSPYTIKASKSVTVEVKQPTNKLVEKKKLTVEVKTPVEKSSNAIKKLAEVLNKKGVTRENFNSSKDIQSILNKYIKKAKITNKNKFLTEIKKKLSSTLQ